MKSFASVLLLLSFAAAQTAAPTGNRVEWNASAPNATQEQPNGQVQKTVASSQASVSAMMDVTAAKRFLDPPSDGGGELTYVVIGIQNTSQQPIRIDPNSITLRVLGKKEKQLKRYSEDRVVERAWYATERYIPTVAPGPGSMGSTGGGEKSVEAAITHQDMGAGDRRMQQGPEQALAQATKLRQKSLAARELAPGESVMGLMFFHPYEKKDKLELSVRLGETDYVIPFAGPKAKP
jgi:hypothetical protein